MDAMRVGDRRARPRWTARRRRSVSRRRRRFPKRQGARASWWPRMAEPEDGPACHHVALLEDYMCLSSADLWLSCPGPWGLMENTGPLGKACRFPKRCRNGDTLRQNFWRTTRDHRARTGSANERRRMSSSVTDGMADTFNARLADAAEQIAEGATGLTPIPPTHRGDNKFDINTPPPILATPPRLPADEGGSLDSPKLSPSAIIRGSSQAMLVCIPVTLPSPAFPLYGILPSLFMHRPSRLRPPCLRPLRRASACTPGIVCSQTEMAAFLERHPSFAQSLRDRVRLHSACSRHSPPARARSS